VHVLPNGNLIPAFCDPSKLNERQEKAQKCTELKNELTMELKRSTPAEIKKLFEERGHEFIVDMVNFDPWDDVSDKGKSIMEKAMGEIQFNLPPITLLYLFDYYSSRSEQGKRLNMNPLHVFARNYGSYSSLWTRGKVETDPVILHMISFNPEWLKQRMTIEDLDMNPVDMAIRTSYRSDLMDFLLKKYQEHWPITQEVKDKLFSSAEWLSESGIYNTAEIGRDLMKKIEQIQVV
jgi:hypothetical protein